MNIAQRFQIQLLRKNPKLKNQKLMNLNQPRGTVLTQFCHLITFLQAITSATSSTRDNASQCSDSYACIFSTATSTSNGNYKVLGIKNIKKKLQDSNLQSPVPTSAPPPIPTVHHTPEQAQQHHHQSLQGQNQHLPTQTQATNPNQALHPQGTPPHHQHHPMMTSHHQSYPHHFQPHISQAHHPTHDQQGNQ